MNLIKFLSLILCAVLVIESGCSNKPTDNHDDKEQLLQLENNWFEGEFTADTASLSSIMDSTFICISERGILNKSEILEHMFDNKSFRDRNEIVIDSFRLEKVVINLYPNTAVVTFIDHTYAKKQGKALESTMQFYDVWIKRNGQWKAVSSQAHY